MAIQGQDPAQENVCTAGIETGLSIQNQQKHPTTQTTKDSEHLCLCTQGSHWKWANSPTLWVKKSLLGILEP